MIDQTPDPPFVLQSSSGGHRPYYLRLVAQGFHQANPDVRVRWVAPEAAERATQVVGEDVLGFVSRVDGVLRGGRWPSGHRDRFIALRRLLRESSTDGNHGPIVLLDGDEWLPALVLAHVTSRHHVDHPCCRIVVMRPDPERRRLRYAKALLALLCRTLGCRVLTLERDRLGRLRTERLVDPSQHIVDEPPSVSRRRLGLRDDLRHDLIIGVIDDRKGIEEWLPALDAACVPDRRVLVVGDPQPPELGDRIRRLADDLSSSEIRLGYVDRVTFHHYLNASDAIIMQDTGRLSSGIAAHARAYSKPLVVLSSAPPATLSDRITMVVGARQRAENENRRRVAASAGDDAAGFVTAILD